MPSESKSSNSSDAFDEKKGSSDAKAFARKADAKDGASDAESKDSGTSDLVSKVIAFFFDDDEFAQTFERFAESHCHVFDIESDEMKLEYTDIYNQFLELFESKLEGTG